MSERLSDCYFHDSRSCPFPRLPISEAAAAGWKIDQHGDDFCPDAVAFFAAEADHAHGWGCDDPFCPGFGSAHLKAIADGLAQTFGILEPVTR